MEELGYVELVKQTSPTFLVGSIATSLMGCSAFEYLRVGHAILSIGLSICLASHLEQFMGPPSQNASLTTDQSAPKRWAIVQKNFYTLILRLCLAIVFFLVLPQKISFFFRAIMSILNHLSLQHGVIQISALMLFDIFRFMRLIFQRGEKKTICEIEQRNTMEYFTQDGRAMVRQVKIESRTAPAEKIGHNPWARSEPKSPFSQAIKGGIAGQENGEADRGMDNMKDLSIQTFREAKDTAWKVGKFLFNWTIGQGGSNS